MSGAGGGALPGRVVVSADPGAVAEAAAGWLLDCAADAVGARGAVDVALAGGSTPAAMYRLLAQPPRRDRARWERWQIWFGDERACPPDDERSNFHLAQNLLLAHVPIPAAQVHRIEGERQDLAAAASDYAAQLARDCPRGPGGAPRLDVVLLGLGTNGHTASLFPGDPSLEVAGAWATPARADYPPYERVTLTFPVLAAAAHVAFVATGAEKGPAFAGVVAGTAPAARVRPLDGELRWFIDEAAAATLHG